MKYSEAKKGRVFVLRLEDGDILHEEIEKFAKEKNIQAASLSVVGGVDKGSTLIVGPEDGRAEKIKPMEHVIDDPHEVTGSGTIFPNKEGKPILHMHLACGRKTSTITGCVRKGVIVWHVLEVIIYEITDSTGKRMPDSAIGFELLIP